MTPNTNTTSGGAADMPEALHRSTAADGKTELFNLPGYPLMVRAVDFNRIHALAAGQATAAQPVAEPAKNDTAYAELPEPDIAVGNDGRALIYTSKDIVGEPYYTAGQLHAFADATHTLRASHGQAPATLKGDTDE